MDGWSEFVDNLKRELDSMFKDEVSVYFDINPSDYLLESYDVDASVKDKLKCLIFIPIISRTYCDTKAFAWSNELKHLLIRPPVIVGFKVSFQVQCHKQSTANPNPWLRSVRFKAFWIGSRRTYEIHDFVYKENCVNRQLRSKDDDIIKVQTRYFTVTR